MSTRRRGFGPRGGSGRRLRRGRPSGGGARAPATEELDRSVLEALDEGVVVLGPDGRATACNRRATEILGLSRHEIVSRRPPFVPAWREGGEPLTERVTGAIASSEPSSVRARIRRPDGAERWLAVSVRALPPAGDSPAGLVASFSDVTRAVAAERAAEEERARAAGVVEAALDSVITIGSDGRVVEFNPAAERTFGWSRGEVVGRELAELIVPPASRTAHRRALKRALATGDERLLGRRVEVRALRRDGAELPCELMMSRIEVAGAPYLTAFLRDLSGQRAAEAAIADFERKLRAVVDAAEIVLFALDREGVFTVSEGGRLSALGLEPGEVVGQSISAVYRDHPQIVRDARRALNGEAFNSVGEMRGLVFNTYWSPVLDDEGALEAVIGVATDITERRRSEERVAHLAYHDGLTGLPNRAQLERELTPVLARAREAGRLAALVHIDLDDFKLVNDSLGHAAGDALLKRVADRLRGATRASDLLARYGGDEFMLLLPELDRRGAEEAEGAARRLLDALSEPLEVGGAELQVGASIGVSLYPRHAEDADDLLKAADAAMYHAKRERRGRFALYTPTGDDSRQRLLLTSRLRRALERGEFVVHYQLVHELRTGRSRHAEALIRWLDPERGMVPPSVFIPLAEHTGLIDPIGEWVLEEILRQARAWQALGLSMPVAYNVSPRQLLRKDFVPRLERQLESAGLDASLLCAEITESAAMLAPERAAAAIHELHALGVTLALDDFGAEHSSLARLRELPVDLLKIDRAFLRAVPESGDACAIVAALCNLAEALGMEAVAEGVETAAQLDFLVALGCPLGQGYRLGHPRPADELTPILVAGRGGAA